MREPQFDEVKIIDPPMQELRKNSSFKRSCLGTIGGLLVVSIGLGIAIRLAVGPGPTKLTTTPNELRGLFPLYDTDRIQKITQISQESQIDRDKLRKFFRSFVSSVKNKEKPATYTRLKPEHDSYEIFEINWKDISTEPAFVLDYYQTELRKKQYTITTANEDHLQIITFKQINQDITGTLQIDFSKTQNTAGVKLTISVPSDLTSSPQH